MAYAAVIKNSGYPIPSQGDLRSVDVETNKTVRKGAFITLYKNETTTYAKETLSGGIIYGIALTDKTDTTSAGTITAKLIKTTV